MKKLCRLVLCALVHALSFWLAAHVFAQADFFKGKTIKIIRGGGFLESFRRGRS